MLKDKNSSDVGTAAELGVSSDQTRPVLPMAKLEKTNYSAVGHLSDNLVLIVAILLLALLCIGYILNYNIGAFPDELAHMGYVVDSSSYGIPNYGGGRIFLTETLNYLPHPFLYYTVAGFLANALPVIDGETAKYIRLINLLFSVAVLLCAYRSMRFFRLGSVDIGFGLLVLLCIPMFSLLGGAVNNDTLSIFGCALGTVGLIGCHRNGTAGSGIYLLVGGFVVAILSKLTGTLALLCIIAAYAILNFKSFKNIINSFDRYVYFLIFTSIGFVCLYYLFIFKFYGELFPAPQGNPSDWFRIDQPNAQRREFIEHLVNFYEANLSTLLEPYGHSVIEDCVARKFILKLILATYPLFIAFSVIGEARKKTGNAMLLISFVLAQIAFLIIYFIKIRSIYISTGYPGAMQARYLFGMLPALVVIYAVGFRHLSSMFFRIPMLILTTCGVGLLFYSSFKPYFYPTVEINATNAVFGELTSGRNFAQRFVANAGRVEGIELLLATFARNNSGEVVLEVLDGHGAIVASASLLAEDLADNRFVGFPIEPFSVKSGNEYTLRLSAPNASPGNAVTWWAFKYDLVSPTKLNGAGYGPPPSFVLNENFGKALAVVDGQPINADFAFRVHFPRN